MPVDIFFFFWGGAQSVCLKRASPYFLCETNQLLAYTREGVLEDRRLFQIMQAVSSHVSFPSEFADFLVNMCVLLQIPLTLRSAGYR